MFSIKNFSLTTILGLTLGVLLAGYAVFAFDPPTVAPPGGNVLAPINVGSDAQVKIGGLSVGSLLVDGGIKTGSFSSLPLCDITTEGTIVFNDAIKKISLCTGSTWEVFPTGVDFDNDGILAGDDCNDGDASIWQNLTGYADADSDGHFASTSPETVCSGSSLPVSHSSTAGDDCNDSSSSAYPGNTAVTSSPDGIDQDCINGIDDTTTAAKTCSVTAVIDIIPLQDACASWCATLGGSGDFFCANQSIDSSWTNFNYDDCTYITSGTATTDSCPVSDDLVCTCTTYH